MDTEINASAASSASEPTPIEAPAPAVTGVEDPAPAAEATETPASEGAEQADQPSDTPEETAGTEEQAAARDLEAINNQLLTNIRGLAAQRTELRQKAMDLETRNKELEGRLAELEALKAPPLSVTLPDDQIPEEYVRIDPEGNRLLGGYLQTVDGKWVCIGDPAASEDWVPKSRAEAFVRGNLAQQRLIEAEQQQYQAQQAALINDGRASLNEVKAELVERARDGFKQLLPQLTDEQINSVAIPRAGAIYQQMLAERGIQDWQIALHIPEVMEQLPEVLSSALKAVVEDYAILSRSIATTQARAKDTALTSTGSPATPAPKKFADMTEDEKESFTQRALQKAQEAGRRVLRR